VLLEITAQRHSMLGVDARFVRDDVLTQCKHTHLNQRDSIPQSHQPYVELLVGTENS